jgi:uncharacterized protein (TIGR03437 family)
MFWIYTHSFARIAIAVSFSLAGLHAQRILGGGIVTVAGVDSRGFIYLAGLSPRDLPTTPGALQPTTPPDCLVPGSACRHGFVAKIPPSGNSLEWATYWAGNGTDSISALAVAPDGNLLIAGSTTSTDLLPDIGGYQTKPASLFIAKLSANGESIMAATYFGGTGEDTIAALKVDSAGSVYVAGDVLSAVFPTTPGAYQRQRGTAPPPANYYQTCDFRCSDQFVAKFTSSLENLRFSTLFGSAAPERTGDLAAGADGTLYIAGVRGPEGAQGPGPTNAIISRFSADASSLVYSTDLGLSSGLEGRSVAVDPEGNAYATASSPRWYIGATSSLTAKLSPLGTIVWSKQIPIFSITSAAVNSRAELVITGLAGRGLQSTAGAPRLCSTYGYPFPVKAAVSRSDTTTGAITYAGFLNADQSWPAGPEQVIAQAPYVGLQQFSLLPAGNPPPGTVTCMASAAVYDSTAIAPGEIVSIFGINVGPSVPYSGNRDRDGNVTTELGGVTVSIAGLPAPILYTDPGQINLVTPFGIPTAGTVPVEVRRNGSLISAFEKQVSDSHAALFTSDGSGFGLLAALNQDGSINSSLNPASLGSVVSVFGTGFGAMSPPTLDGAAACKANTKPLADVSVLVYGASDGPVYSAPGTIEYVGNTPCLVAGVVQINFRIPSVIRAYYGTVTITVKPGAAFGTIAVR